MQGGGVQDVIDQYVAGAMLSVEAAIDDEMNKMENLNVCSRLHTCHNTHSCCEGVCLTSAVYVLLRRTTSDEFGPTAWLR